MNAYRVWISEIMLQQTRVEAVKSYYTRFLEELPDIKALAEVPEDRLLKLWEGLGYYNRARNLKAAAQQVMEEYNGVFPDTFEEIKKLKGIGSYTAYKGLLLHPRLSLQRACYIMQVTHLIPLVGGECDLLLRTILTAAGICDKGLHLEVLRCHQCTGHTVQVNAFIALIDMVGFRFAGYGRGRVKPCLHTQSCFQ